MIYRLQCNVFDALQFPGKHFHVLTYFIVGDT